MMYNDMNGFGFMWMILMGLIIVIPFWRICSKAGYPGVLSLLVFVPLVNIGFFYFLGFSQWPIHKGNQPESSI